MLCRYGIIAATGELVARGAKKLPYLGKHLKAKEDAEKQGGQEGKEEGKEAGASPVDRIEARQLEMSDKLELLIETLGESGSKGESRGEGLRRMEGYLLELREEVALTTY